jgi:putative FmdB family regulatory protein
MPAYDYICKTCGLEFEEIVTIDKRHEPCKAPCDYCEQVEAQCEIEIKVASPFIGDPIRQGLKKPDRAFNDKLKEIKKAHYGNTVKVYD